MACLHKIQRVLLLAMLTVLAAPATAEIDAALQLRFMSQAIRDQSPTVAEAKAFYNKDRDLDSFVDEWLSSPEHLRKIERYFNDMFGVQASVFIAPEDLYLDFSQVTGPVENQTNSPADLVGLGAAGDGVYHLHTYVKSDCFPSGVTPSAGALIDATVWWSDSTVKMCPTAVSPGFTANAGANNCAAAGANGIGHEDCGCGNMAMLCMPDNYRGKMTVAITKEFARRGVHAYQQDWSWNSLFGGSTFYGDRWLYFNYLYQDKIIVELEEPSAAELAILASLPAPTAADDESRGTAAYPPDSSPRSGVVTMPGFMRQFNNFRSRIRALSEQLLCRDIDSTLNTSGIDYFVNTADLTDFDKTHGLKAGCDSCHYSLDNLGTTILGWDQNAFRTHFWNPNGDGSTYLPYDPSGLGHVFGVNGNGPEFLIRGFVERGPGFHDCMAQKAWAAFGGQPWNDVPDATKSDLIDASAGGPRDLIRAVLTSQEFAELRTNKLVETVTTAPVTYDFNTDINPILERSCAGAACHSSGTSLGSTYEFVGNANSFRAANEARVLDGSMPPAGTLSITAEEAQTLYLYLTQ